MIVLIFVKFYYDSIIRAINNLTHDDIGFFYTSKHLLLLLYSDNLIGKYARILKKFNTF